MNSLRSTVIPQMQAAKTKAEKLEKLGRLKNIDVFLFKRKADNMIQFLEELEETEVMYGQASGDQAGE